MLIINYSLLIDLGVPAVEQFAIIDISGRRQAVRCSPRFAAGCRFHPSRALHDVSVKKERNHG
jgi:hypothetical protein